MPEPEKYFWKQIRKYDVDDRLIELPTVKKVENYITDLSEDCIDSLKKSSKDNNVAPPQPIHPIPTLAESAFIKRDKETTLYNVTQKEDKVPSHQLSLKNISLKVRSFDLFTNYKFNGQKLSLITGERCGVEYQKNLGDKTFESFKATYKIPNQKSEITYKHQSKIETYSASIYQQRDNIGFTSRYSNKNGFNSAFSIDKNSAAINCSYYKQTDKYKSVEIGAFATLGNKFSEPFIGINGRMTI